MRETLIIFFESFNTGLSKKVQSLRCSLLCLLLEGNSLCPVLTALSSNDKTIGGITWMQNVVSVLANVPASVELVIIQFADQINMTFFSQLISDISRVPLKESQRLAFSTAVLNLI